MHGAAKGLQARQLFIRAPSVTDAGSAHVLAKTKEGVIAAVHHGRFLGTAFHPELSTHDDWMSFFIRVVCGAKQQHLNPAHSIKDASLVAPWTGHESEAVKRAFAVFQKGGVIMDVVVSKRKESFWPSFDCENRMLNKLDLLKLQVCLI